MVNIYDKANEFEKALRESAEYKEAEKASEVVYEDSEAKALYVEFVQTQKKFMEGMQMGVEPEEEDLKAFEELQKKLMVNEKILGLVQAQQKLQFIIEDLNRVMFKPLDELFAKYEEEAK